MVRTDSLPSLSEYLEDVAIDLASAARHHVAFLRKVFSQSWPFDQRAVRDAIRRYETVWLPLAVNYAYKNDLCPPEDVLFVWTVHMQAPRAYERDCLHFPDNAGVFDHRVFSAEEREAAERITKKLWQRETDEPWKPVINDMKFHSQLSYDLESAIERQWNFFYQVSLPHYEDKMFLSFAERRYRKYLMLKKMNIGESLYPCYDIDLIWHVHMLHPIQYDKETSILFGTVLDHDDSIKDRKGLLTRSLWQRQYGEGYDCPGTLYRGTPSRGRLRGEVDRRARIVIDRMQLKGYEGNFFGLKIVEKPAGTDGRGSKIERDHRNRRPANGDGSAGDQRPANGDGSAGDQRPANGDREFWEDDGDGDLRGDTALLEVNGPTQCWDGKRNGIPFYAFDARQNVVRFVVQLQPRFASGLEDGDFLESDVVELKKEIGKTQGLLLTLHDQHGISDTYVRLSATVFDYASADFPVVLQRNKFTLASLLACDDHVKYVAVDHGENEDSQLFTVTHGIRPHGEEATLQLSVHYPDTMKFAVVTLRANEEIVAYAHSIGLEQLPTPPQVVSLESFPLDEKRNEQALLIKDNVGDWGILFGAWHSPLRPLLGSSGFLETTSAEEPPGDPEKRELLFVRFYNFRQKRWYHHHIPSYEGSWLVNMDNIKFDLQRGWIKCAENCSDMPQQICLVFSVAVLFALCQYNVSRAREPYDFEGKTLLEAVGANNLDRIRDSDDGTSHSEHESDDSFVHVNLDDLKSPEMEKVRHETLEATINMKDIAEIQLKNSLIQNGFPASPSPQKDVRNAYCEELSLDERLSTMESRDSLVHSQDTLAQAEEAFQTREATTTPIFVLDENENITNVLSSQHQDIESLPLLHIQKTYERSRKQEQGVTSFVTSTKKRQFRDSKTGTNIVVTPNNVRSTRPHHVASNTNQVKTGTTLIVNGDYCRGRHRERERRALMHANRRHNQRPISADWSHHHGTMQTADFAKSDAMRRAYSSLDRDVHHSAKRTHESTEEMKRRSRSVGPPLGLVTSLPDGLTKYDRRLIALNIEREKLEAQIRRERDAAYRHNARQQAKRDYGQRRERHVDRVRHRPSRSEPRLDIRAAEEYATRVNRDHVFGRSNRRSFHGDSRHVRQTPSPDYTYVFIGKDGRIKRLRSMDI